MEPLVVRLARWRFILLALLMLPFALLGLLLLPEDDVALQVMGLGFLALFGGLMVFALVKVIQHKPVLIVSDEGIEDRRLKIGIIPWGEVIRAYELPYLWHKNVQVQVRNPEQFKRKQPVLIRTLGELNVAAGWAPFVLVTANTDTPARSVVDYIYQQLALQWPTPTPTEEATTPAAQPDKYPTRL
ncbi:STM3941 family protein [Hymenobacter sp. CRA2]|uniref:STM3941 family protein n=1 Tax=Hymenobacter sp. CRA2 TaxID=1955620 RepID=UPI00098ECF1A|nr:STM3941 family protein [Hymenobacter sp. CRA2]OON68517.1 hypothetical protein B0919_12800 [Hymenobacter sp. CRA2]